MGLVARNVLTPEKALFLRNQSIRWQAGGLGHFY